MIGGRVVYEDGAVYHGDFLNNLEHGLGTMKRRGGRSLFAGRWREGFEELGVLEDNCITFAGQWADGRRDGLGTESSRDVRFSGDWTEGAQSRYGVADYTKNESSYMGIWVDSKPEEYGTHEYADSGTYRGQWLNGRKTGFGVRRSGQYGNAALLMKYKPTISAHIMGFVLPISPPLTRINVVETYRGQWMDGRRCGYGIGERSDGHKYEGEWRDDMRHGYGITTKTDGTKTCGRYKNGNLVTDLGSVKGKLIGALCGYRARLEESVRAATLAAYIADLKANIAAQHAQMAIRIGQEAYKVHKEAHYQADLALIHAVQFHFADAG